MRELRLLAPAESGSDLILEVTDDGGTSRESATGIRERFRLPVDDALRAATAAHGATASPSPSPFPRPTAEPVSRPAAAAPSVPEAPVEIAPRDIQMRIRAGESPEDLAASLGVPVQRVLRFAAPVVGERLRIADEARRARARRTDSAENVLVQFGETVDGRFVAHGIEAADVGWDSFRREDGEWIVVATWLGGTGEHTAQWLFTRATRTVSPLDDAAGDLLSDRPIRVVVAAPEQPAAPLAPPLAPGVVAFPVMPDAHTGPLPRIEDVFDQEAPAEGPRAVPPLVPEAQPHAEPATAAGPAQPDPVGLRFETGGLMFEEPPLPLSIADPAAVPGVDDDAFAARLANLRNPQQRTGLRNRTKTAESDEEKAARARVPSWDDILLGVRRKQD